MDDKARQAQQVLLEAVKKGGPAAAFEALSQMGVAVDQAPEPGVGVRMRSGVGTEDAFTTTQYLPAAGSPKDWPAGLPFLPDTAASVTRFDRPGRGLAVQWWRVADPTAATARILRESLASGWHEQSDLALPEVFASSGLRLTVVERAGVTRTVMGAVLKGAGFVALTER